MANSWEADFNQIPKLDRPKLLQDVVLARKARYGGIYELHVGTVLSQNTGLLEVQHRRAVWADGVPTDASSLAETDDGHSGEPPVISRVRLTALRDLGATQDFYRQQRAAEAKAKAEADERQWRLERATRRLSDAIEALIPGVTAYVQNDGVRSWVRSDGIDTFEQWLDKRDWAGKP